MFDCFNCKYQIGYSHFNRLVLQGRCRENSNFAISIYLFIKINNLVMNASNLFLGTCKLRTRDLYSDLYSSQLSSGTLQHPLDSTGARNSLHSVDAKLTPTLLNILTSI